MICRFEISVFLLIIVLSVFCDNCEARGLFGSLGRSLRQVGREVTGAVKDTTEGVKSDVQGETGIPIAEIEMRDRIGKVRRQINQIQLAVLKPSIADGAIVFFWNSIGAMNMEDGESLMKVVEYTEGTITDNRKEGISVKKLLKVVGRLEKSLMSLSDKRQELPADFDFVSAFDLSPAEESASEDGNQNNIDSSSDDYASGNVDGEDPVTAGYKALLAEHGNKLQGSGYLKIGAGPEAGEAVFAMIDPATGTILTQDAAVNQNHKIAAGIYHIVIDVGDVRLYKLNTLVLGGSLVKFDFVDFGQVQIGADVSGTVEIFDNASGRLACEGIVADQKITLPIGEYTVVHVDGGEEETVVVMSKKGKTVSF